MEATIPGPGQGTNQHTQAPEHIVAMLVPVWRRMLTGPAGLRPGSADYAKAVRAEVRRYADRIWAEAFQAGAVYGVAHSGPTRILVMDRTEVADGLIETLLAREEVAGGR